MNNKILSISVAAYNIEKFIEQAINSYLECNCKEELEVLIINDGSTDRTKEIVEEYSKKYPDTIKLITQKNAGPGSTVNTGIKYATGKYFKMIDGDDWVETENLNKFIEILRQSDEDMILTNYEVFDNIKKEIIAINKVELASSVSFDFENICSTLRLDMHNVAYKTDILKKNNIILDNCFYTDVEYLLLPIPFVKTVKYLDLNIYVYRVAQATQSVSITSMQKNINMHFLVLNRLMDFYVENKNNISKGKQEYIKRRVFKMASAHLGILLTFEANKENKQNIINFNKLIKSKCLEIYKEYKRTKRAGLLILSNYVLYGFISKKYKNKMNK